jgi:UDP-3-O-[3-hydroxymyristoyl] glucosamine N-acyltransferase
VNITLKKISEKFNVEFIGDGSYEINMFLSIANANENSIIFLSDKNFLKFLDETKSKTVVTTKELSKFCKNNIIICDNPYLLFAKISQLINKQDKFNIYNVHSSVVSSTQTI